MAFEIHSNIVDKKKLRKVQTMTLDTIEEALVNSFGPDGTNTAFRREKDIARYTKDGHTILKNLMFNGAIEFTMRDNLEDITRRIITTVGDGTTSAIVLSAEIFKCLRYANEKLHINEKKLIEDFNRAIKEAIEVIESRKKETTVEDIYKIALISTDNNEYIANLISDIYKQYGMEVFIDVSVNNSINTYTKEYDGYTIPSGLSDVAFINNTEKHTCEIKSPKIYLFEDPIDTIETSAFMEKIIFDNIMNPYNKKDFENIVPTIIICPKIGRDINTSMDQLITFLAQFDPSKRSYFPINIVTNITDPNYIMDLSYISGAKMIKKYIDPMMQKKDQEAGLAPTLDTIHEFAGSCDLCVTDATKTKLINPALMYDENHELTTIYKNRLGDMENQLAGLMEAKTDLQGIGMLKRRINAFKANLVEIFVGGISETDRDALRDLVEDAVLNCRSAATDGYGYGANYEGFNAFTLLYLNSVGNNTEEMKAHLDSISKEDIKNYYNIYYIFMQAYNILYKHLYRSLDEETFSTVFGGMIVKRCPFNIRTKDFDGLVLSSIKTDIIILEAIGKIISTVFLTNQFLVSGVQYNVYAGIKDTE